MPVIINEPSIIKAAGNKEKIIKEHFGIVSSNSPEVSIAHMKSPEGWEEPGQCPEFDEYTVIFKGLLRVKTKDEEYLLKQGEAIMTRKGEWVQYSTPFSDGAEYISVCIPAFSPELVNRDIS